MPGRSAGGGPGARDSLRSGWETSRISQRTKRASIRPSPGACGPQKVALFFGGNGRSCCGSNSWSTPAPIAVITTGQRHGSPARIATSARPAHGCGTFSGHSGRKPSRMLGGQDDERRSRFARSVWRTPRSAARVHRLPKGRSHQAVSMSASFGAGSVVGFDHRSKSERLVHAAGIDGKAGSDDRRSLTRRWQAVQSVCEFRVSPGRHAVAGEPGALAMLRRAISVPASGVRASRSSRCNPAHGETQARRDIQGTMACPYATRRPSRVFEVALVSASTRPRPCFAQPNRAGGRIREPAAHPYLDRKARLAAGHGCVDHLPPARGDRLLTSQIHPFKVARTALVHSH